MAKTGPLGDVEKFYIENKFQDYSVEQLAKKLNRPKATIQKHVEVAKETRVHEPDKGQETLFASHKGSTVMTRAASELGDEIRRSNKDKKPDSRCTTNIK